MEDFNLHLTGDVHAIGAAHNLAGAFIDNSLHHKNPLGIDPHGILWPRVLDISDRALRHVVIGLGGREDGIPRETEFVITVASEVMAVLALATDLQDLRARLGRMVLATRTDATPVTAERPRCRRRDGRAAARRAQAEPSPDPRGRASLRPRRSVREHRPRQQLDHRRPDRPRHERDRLHRSGLRGRHGRREVLRHQVPGVWSHARCGRRGRHGPGAEDERWRRQDRGRQAARSRTCSRTIPDAVRIGCANLAKQIENVTMFGIPAVVAINSFPTDTAAEVEVIRQEAHRRGRTRRRRRDPFRRRRSGCSRARRGRLDGGERRKRRLPVPLSRRDAAGAEDRDHRDEGLRRATASSSCRPPASHCSSTRTSATATCPSAWPRRSTR